MKVGILPFFLFMLFAAPQLAVDGSAASALRVRVTAATEDMRTCVQQGLELRYQFMVQVCRERSYWFDDCVKQRKAISTLSFDPITGSFQVERDLYDDEEDPNQKNFSSVDKAFPFAAVSMQFSAEHLGMQKEGISGRKRVYLRYRGVAFCKQNYNRTLDRIAQTLSLGLISFERYDSGWKEVPLESEGEQESDS